MKSIISIVISVFFIQTFVCFAQENVAVELVEAKVMYRGYSNVIFVPQDSCNGYVTDVIVLNNGTVEKSDKPNEYFVFPDSGRHLDLAVVRKMNDIIVDTLRIAQYAVRNLPAPQLYWGPYENGAVVNSFEDHLFARYGDHIYLTNSFLVLSWTFYVGDKSTSGDGRNVSMANKLLKEITPPTKVIIIAKVKGPESTEFEIHGEWVVMPGSTHRKYAPVID